MKNGKYLPPKGIGPLLGGVGVGSAPLQLGLLLLVTLPALFWQLEAADLTLMEARNFVTAREIGEHGNWLLPTMNGQLRLAKPPLPTWITLVSALAAGDVENLAALRFPAAAMAAALVLFTWLLARELSADKLVPLLSALVLASSFAFVQAGRQGTWDIYCHSFMGGAIWLFVRACRRPGPGYGLFAACGIMLATSFLSKGPVSFYALLLPLGIAWYTRKNRPSLSGKNKPLALATGLTLVLALAWPAYVWLQVPHDLVAMASRESTAWLERHNRPFWFYWSFPVETGAWALLAAASLAIPYMRSRAGRYGNYSLL
ncbi:MAG: ArnT family glycosyltransferase, partial [Adhaeribacter sp.]